MATIGQVSVQTGINIETIRYYEKCGLLPKPARTEGGHRVYDDRQKDRLAFIRRGRELGFSLEDIRDLLKAADGKMTCHQVSDITSRHLNNVRAKIRDLKRLERVLAQTVLKCGKGNAPKCPVIDAITQSALIGRPSSTGKPPGLRRAATAR